MSLAACSSLLAFYAQLAVVSPVQHQVDQVAMADKLGGISITACVQHRFPESSHCTRSWLHVYISQGGHNRQRPSMLTGRSACSLIMSIGISRTQAETELLLMASVHQYLRSVSTSRRRSGAGHIIAVQCTNRNTLLSAAPVTQWATGQS